MNLTASIFDKFQDGIIFIKNKKNMLARKITICVINSLHFIDIFLADKRGRLTPEAHQHHHQSYQKSVR
jgi:hypothetical protein